jgi:multidrug resistance efflux pump
MIELIFGFYALIWWLIFRKFRLLPINLWTTVTSVFIAGSTIIFLLLWVGRYQPITSQARTYAVTVPVISEVAGRVIEVAPVAGQRLSRADMLFRIDPEPYEARLAAVEAQLALAENRLDQEQRLIAQGAGRQYDLDVARSDAERLRAELRTANYQLAATVVRAPSDGRVVQVAIRPGQFVMPMAFSQMMVFVPEEEPRLAAGFRQNAMTYIDVGDRAEVAFDALPGRVFAGRVASIQPLLAEGAASASGTLRTMDDQPRRGRIPVFIDITDDMSAYHLPAGSSATATVYTGKMHHFDVVRMMIIRIKSWENWVFAP